ncbi:MAG: hypothetical protein EOP11_21670 [Proteobacteria bacterium]|nr:MAG: hypothetical protein EOP11_21670 [Pseudomonadota bacterium]
MLEEISLKRQLAKDAAFSPPFCPNPACPKHVKPEPTFWYRFGTRPINRFPYTARRYCCKTCQRPFSGSYFSLGYRAKRWGHNKEIHRLHGLGVSKCEIGRQIEGSERMVRRRIIKMARWALLKHASLTETLKIEEEIVYDGIENFAYSQYDINNLNHAVGKQTLFTYDFNLCPLNRKGRMSPEQVVRLNKIEHEHGRYPGNAIRTSTRRIFERLFAKAPKLVIYSDRHYQYRRVLEIDMRDKPIEHVQVCSKVVRNYQNPLFAINNIDNQARHNLAAFKRETIAFSKHSVAMLESFVLYMTQRNYMRPKFWKSHRADPLSSKRSPAMELGLTKKIEKFDDFFAEKIPLTHVKLNEDWLNLYLHRDPTSRRKIV